MSQKTDDVYDLSEMIKQEFYECMPDLEASFYTDLLTAGLSEVCWYEIAEHIWNDTHE